MTKERVEELMIRKIKDFFGRGSKLHQYTLCPVPVENSTRGLEHDFYCPWTFASCYHLKTSDGYRPEDVSYELCGRAYTGIQDFHREKLRDYPEYQKPKSEPCRVSAWRDVHGTAVLRIAVDVPTFDSGDRTYDGCHELCLIHDGKQVSGVYCASGYHIGRLELCRNLQKADSRVRPWLEEQGFPIKGIQFL